MKIRILWSIVLSALSFAGGSAFAGRPLTVDDAEPSDMGQWQIELGVGYRDDGESHHFDFPVGLAYGLAQDIEVGIGFGGQIEERAETENEMIRETGLGDLTLGVKWKFADEKRRGFAMSLAPTIKLPTADDEKGLGSGETDYDITWILTKPLSEELSVHGNVGYTGIGDPEGEDLGDIVHFGVAGDYTLFGGLQWVGEIFAQEDLKNSSAVCQYNTGLRWDGGKGLTFDISAGSKLSGAAPDLTVNTGITLAF
mgnify:CR=1 FL=1